jgi:hypothetical protein
MGKDKSGKVAQFTHDEMMMKKKCEKSLKDVKSFFFVVMRDES